jgi:hypothetical protein
MLDHVEHSYLVKQKNGQYCSSRYLTIDGIGPIGWRKVVEKELKS